MVEQFVTFETAKLAKEKGFNEFCRKTFNTEGKSTNLSGYMEMKKWNINDKVHLYDTDSEEFENPDIECTQPTQSFLQTWLRVEHDIEVVVHRDLEVHYQNEVKWVVLVNNWNSVAEINTPIAVLSRPQHTNKMDFTSYEDALEEGLRIGLNYII